MSLKIGIMGQGKTWLRVMKEYMSLKIGITESSDPSYDKTWLRELFGVDGLILVTKGLAQPGMIEDILTAMKIKPTILHCTCTGWGGTAMEPGVPNPEDTMKALEQLIRRGFPAKNVVLRIDPIIPSAEGIKHFKNMLAHLTQLNINIAETKQQVTRVRISIMDNYKHVKKRFQATGYEPMYDGQFQAAFADLYPVIDALKLYPNFEYSSCAEKYFVNRTDCKVKPQGCISKEDLEIMGLLIKTDDNLFENPQSRSGCHCLSCKTEILSKNHTCPHGCLYCYWKRSGE